MAEKETRIDTKIFFLVSLSLPENITEFFQRASVQLGLLPQVGRQETVCVGDSDEGSLQGVLEGLGRTGGGCVDVLDTGQLEQTLNGGGSDETSTTGSRNQLIYVSIVKLVAIPTALTYANSDGTTLSTLLGGQRVRLTQVGTPVPSADRKNAQLGDDDSGADSSCDFLGGLDTETDVALGVANDNNGLETSALTGTGLFLDGFDLDRGLMY